MLRHGILRVGASEILAHGLNLRCPPHPEREELHDFADWLALAEADCVLDLLVCHIVSF
jgi:hypothetical protein